MDRNPIKWDDSVATGLLWQDHQHRQLLNHLTDLSVAIKELHSAEVLDGMLTYLEGYTDDHLVIEEDYMIAFNYPTFEAHLKAHNTFRENLQRIKTTHEDECDTMAAMCLCFDLQEWFLNHIKTFDLQLGDFLRSKDLQ